VTVPVVAAPAPIMPPTAYGDTVTFTRACPGCGQPALWTATKAQTPSAIPQYTDACPCTPSQEDT
jgi:hypothetical protein